MKSFYQNSKFAIQVLCRLSHIKDLIYRFYTEVLAVTLGMSRQYIKKSRKTLINKGKTDIRGNVLHTNYTQILKSSDMTFGYILKDGIWLSGLAHARKI